VIDLNDCAEVREGGLRDNGKHTIMGISGGSHRRGRPV